MAVSEKAAGLYAIGLRIAGRQFGLLEPDAQDYQLAQWSKVLHGFVAERPTIASIRWTEWSAPAGIDEQRTWLDRHIAKQHLPDVLASYQTLLADLSTPPPVTKSSSRSRRTRRRSAYRNATKATDTRRSSRRSSPKPAP